MKRFFLFAISFIFAISLSAQMPDLPEILQEQFEQEQLDLTISYDEQEQEKTEEDYYRFIERTGGSDTLLGYRWHKEIEDWILKCRIIVTKNDEEKPSDKLIQLLTDDGSWKNGLFFQYTYNDNSQLTELLIQYWRGDSLQWVNHFRKELSFNDGGNLSDILTQWWSKFNDEWVDHHNKVFTYNGDQLQADTVFIFIFMMEEWKNFRYDEFAYNDSGLRTSKTMYFWWFFLEEWKKTHRYNYTYDDSGEQIITVVGQKWFGDDAGWKDKHRYNYTYNDAGDLTLYLFEAWNHFDSLWMEKVKFDYYYNDAGWLSQYVWQFKHFEDEAWKNKKQVFFTYDDSGNVIERLNQRWGVMSEEWVNFSKWEMVLEYYKITGLFDEKESNKIAATFRNPYQTGDQIRFSGLESGNYSLQLYNLNGQLVEVAEMGSSDQASFRTNPGQGLYIMVLNNNGKRVFNSKLLVTR